MEPVWRVLIFLAPLCPICQNMSFDLRPKLEKDTGEPLEFVGVFPNASTTEAQIAAFQQTYDLNMTMGKDTAHWAEALGARWTQKSLSSMRLIRWCIEAASTTATSPLESENPRPSGATSMLRCAIAGRARRLSNPRDGRRGMPHRRGVRLTAPQD